MRNRCAPRSSVRRCWRCACRRHGDRARPGVPPGVRQPRITRLRRAGRSPVRKAARLHGSSRARLRNCSPGHSTIRLRNLREDRSMARLSRRRDGLNTVRLSNPRLGRNTMQANGLNTVIRSAAGSLAHVRPMVAASALLTSVPTRRPRGILRTGSTNTAVSPSRIGSGCCAATPASSVWPRPISSG